LRAEKLRHDPPLLINEDEEGVSAPAIAFLQPDDGRYVRFQARHSYLPRKFLCQPMHDRLHLQSRRSTISVKHDQRWAGYLKGGRLGFRATACQRR